MAWNCDELDVSGPEGLCGYFGEEWTDAGNLYREGFFG